VVKPKGGKVDERSGRDRCPAQGRKKVHGVMNKVEATELPPTKGGIKRPGGSLGIGEQGRDLFRLQKKLLKRIEAN